jgi:DNA/RNA endonuclease YhcR with UshA esterase domain
MHARAAASILLFTAVMAAAATAAVIPAASAGSHVGQSATVEGVVSEVHTARSGKETFIDIGGNYPNQIFTAVIFAPNMAAVGDVSGLTGKTVDLTGTIQSYQGKPEVIITSRAQIKVKG